MSYFFCTGPANLTSVTARVRIVNPRKSNKTLAMFGQAQARTHSTARPELHQAQKFTSQPLQGHRQVPRAHATYFNVQTLPKLEVLNTLPDTTACRFWYSTHPATYSTDAVAGKSL